MSSFKWSPLPAGISQIVDTTYDPAFSAPGAVVTTLVKIGRTVTMNITGDLINTSDNILSSVPLPAEYWPVSDFQACIPVTDNGAEVFGAIFISSSNGDIEIGANAAFGNFTTTGGWPNITVTWMTA